jgi:hypothetical protein
MTTNYMIIMAAGALGAGTIGLATGGLLLLWLFNGSESKAKHAAVPVERRDPVPNRIPPAVIERIEQREPVPNRIAPPEIKPQRPVSTRSVLINGQRLSDQQLQGIEQRYPGRIP